MPTIVDNTVIVDFEFERATKGTVRFAEVVAEGEEPAVGTLYLRKERLAEAGIDVDAAEGTKVTATFTLA